MPSLPKKVVAIHRAFADAKVPHAIGGALALAYYAEPRATIDVDVNVFVATDAWPRVSGALGRVGVDVATDESALQRDGQVRLWWDRNPVDVFFAYDPFHDEMKAAVRRVPFAGTTMPILSPEHLAVCKAMLDRPKDWLDLEAMLVVTDPLDVGSIETWLRRMAGADDRRLEKLGDLVDRLDLRP
jgi:hypothetical protein